MRPTDLACASSGCVSRRQCLHAQAAASLRSVRAELPCIAEMLRKHFTQSSLGEYIFALHPSCGSSCVLEFLGLTQLMLGVISRTLLGTANSVSVSAVAAAASMGVHARQLMLDVILRT